MSVRQHLGTLADQAAPGPAPPFDRDGTNREPLPDESVAGAAHGEEVRGPLRVGLHLGPKLGDEVVDRAGRVRLAEPPHLAEQLLPREDALLVAAEKAQQL